MKSRYCVLGVLSVLALALFVPLAHAQLDAPTISLGVSGHGKQTVTITAGPSGAPEGFTVWWMDASQFASNNGEWPADAVPGQGHATFTGTPTLNTFGGTQTTFKLAPNQTIIIEVGDLFDETGVAGVLNELQYGSVYHFVAFAHDASGAAVSGLSQTVMGATTASTNCTYTLGYWKNHTNVWPVGSLTLGSVSYTQAQLLSIFGQPVQGNGLISLAHQLIAAKLNIANGADPTAAAAAIASADALIGALVVPPVGGGSLAPNQTSSLTQTLDNFNNGVTGPGHCGEVSVAPASWGKVKSLYR